MILLMIVTGAAISAAWFFYYRSKRLQADLFTSLRISRHLGSVITSISVFDAMDAAHMRLIRRTSEKICQIDGILQRLLDEYESKMNQDDRAWLSW